MEKAMGRNRTNIIWAFDCIWGMYFSMKDGTVKLTSFKDDKQVETIEICKQEGPVYRLSQSITGNLVSVSVDQEEQTTYVYAEK